MKRILAFLTVCGLLTMNISAHAQDDKSKRPSPPAKVTQTIKSGATITIDYSQPGLKGRTIGSTVEPMKGKIWRMGANEATVFETNKDVTIEGQKLPAGKYSLWGLWGDDGYTLIFNSAYSIWGTQHDENKDKDVLKVVVRPRTTKDSQERLTYTIDKNGTVTMRWGTMAIDFHVK
ncbi:MAG: DUF2911 domain-containing protein [Flavisolibacter sp.]